MSCVRPILLEAACYSVERLVPLGAEYDAVFAAQLTEVGRFDVQEKSSGIMVRTI